MRLPLVLVLAGLLALGTAACKSSLRVRVEQYQGDLILSPEAQLARIEAMARATFSSMNASLDAVQALEGDLAAFEQDHPDVRVGREKRALLREFDRLTIGLLGSALPACIAKDLRSSIKAVRDALAADELAAPPDGAGGAKGERERADVQADAAEAKDDTSSGITAQGLAAADAELEQQIERAVRWVLQGEDISGQHLADDQDACSCPSGGRADDAQGTRFARFAELMHSLARSLEVIDPDVSDYVDWTYFGVADRDYDPTDPTLVFDGPVDDHCGPDCRRGGPHACRAAGLVARYNALFFDAWQLLYENYPRVSGLANFRLKLPEAEDFGGADRETAAQYRAANHAVLLDAEARVLARLRALGDAENALGEEAQAELQELKAVRRQLEELQSAYQPIQSTGAYLALELVQEQIRNQRRPGEGRGAWNEVTEVVVEAGANANYVVMRDHLGNWQVKAARNDATELVNAVYGTALGVIDIATQTGSVTDNLRAAYRDFSERQREARVDPFAIDELLALLREDLDSDLAAIEAAGAAAEQERALKRARLRVYAERLSELEVAVRSAGDGG